jgi:hypothetical protein
MRGGADRGRDLLALEVVEARDPLIGVDPELRGAELDAVGEEHLALAARRKVRDDRTRREHVDTAADQRLKQLEAGRELDPFHLEPLLLEAAGVVGQPELAVDR